MWKPGQEPDTQTIQFSCSSCVLCILLFFSLLSVPCFALPAGALPYPCPSLGDGGLIQERLVIWVKCLAQIFHLPSSWHFARAV